MMRPEYSLLPQLDISHMPQVPMQRIILHWTAGHFGVMQEELRHYHGIIDNLQRFHWGVPIEYNVAPIEQGEMYAAHTRGLNSGSIGIAVDCMAGAEETPTGCNPGRSPFTEAMYWAMIHYVNQIALRYNIPVRHDTIFSHAEAHLLGYPQAGKWDFTRLPFDPTIMGARAIGDKIRRDILAMRGEQKPVMNTVREKLDTGAADVAIPTTGGIAGYGANAQGESMLQNVPPADAVPADWYSQISNFGYTATAQGFAWGGRILLAVTLGVALWTAFKYIRYAWRKKFPPKPNDVERARGVD